MSYISMRQFQDYIISVSQQPQCTAFAIFRGHNPLAGFKNVGSLCFVLFKRPSGNDKKNFFILLFGQQRRSKILTKQLKLVVVNTEKEQ